MARSPLTFRQNTPLIPGREVPWQIGGEDVDTRSLYRIVRQLAGEVDGLTANVSGSATAALSGFTPVDDSTFAWVNQSGATTTSADGRTFLLRTASAADGLHMRTKALPPAPYKITLGFIPMQPFADFSAVGLFLRESGSGKVVVLELLSNSFLPAVNAQQKVIYLEKWSSPTVSVAGYITTPVTLYAPCWQEGANMWFQFEDDGALRYSRVSNDGSHFYEISNLGNTDYITPDEYGFFVRNFTTNFDVGMEVVSLAIA